MAGFAAVGAAALVLAGCAAAPEEAPAPTAPETTSPAVETDFLACAVSDEGSWQDKSFNEAVYDGLLQAQSELGVQILALESTSDVDFDPNMQAAVEANCDITFAVGFKLADVANRFAEAHPDMNFALVDDLSNFPNLKQLQYSVQESSYLAGYLSAAYSTTKVIGTYGGMNFPSVTGFMDGFYYGAQAWAADSGQPVTVLGWDPANPEGGDFVGNFSDTSIAKQISLTQIEQGADVILPVAGGLFTATAEAIDESGKDVVMLGVDKDIALTQPDYAKYILTSIEKGLTASVMTVITEMVETGSFSGEGYVGTLANGGTLISPLYGFESKVDAGVLQRLAELEAGIISGSITVIP
jgi:basic membrane protein A